MGGLLGGGGGGGGGGGAKGMLPPLSNYWGGGWPSLAPPLFLRLCSAPVQMYWSKATSLDVTHVLITVYEYGPGKHSSLAIQIIFSLSSS